jgi:hypothetical protein
MRDFSNYMQRFAHSELMLEIISALTPLFAATLKNIYFGNGYAIGTA